MNRCPGSYTGSTSNDVPFEHGIWSGTYGLAAMTPESAESGIFTLKAVGECMPVLQLNVTREWQQHDEVHEINWFYAEMKCRPMLHILRNAILAKCGSFLFIYL